MIKVDENGIVSVTEVRAVVETEVESDAKKENKNVDNDRHHDHVMLSTVISVHDYIFKI